MCNTVNPLEQRVHAWLAASEFADHAERFWCFLERSGYARRTRHRYRASLAHFALWMRRHRVVLGDVDERVIERFLTQHLPVCRCGPLRQRSVGSVRAALKAALRYLRREEIIGKAVSADPPAIAKELQDFDDYQERVCGLTQATRDVSRRRVRAFLLHCFGKNTIRIHALTSRDLMRFVDHYTKHCTPRSRSVICRSIRGYLRFKALSDPYADRLRARMPTFALWRLASVVKSLSKVECEAVLEATTRTDTVGRRDYAMLRCLADLGLRTVEVARLQLADIDWRAGTVVIRGKGHRIDVMPLPSATGKAIAEYVYRDRPNSEGPALFFRYRPPHWTPATVFVVRAAARYAAKRAGLAHRVGGPHIFRHSLAQRLVKERASLKSIADLLRHRSLKSTRVYAKVDLPALSGVASPWPGSRP
jgi:integrase/recombinase XerD